MNFCKFIFVIIIFGSIPPAVHSQAAVKGQQIGVRFTEMPAGEVRRRTVKSSNEMPTAAAIFEIEKYAFQLLNEHRRSEGLSALVWSDDVAKVARLHSRNMASKGFFSHRGTDGSMVDGRADEQGLGEWRAIGENIAFLRGYDDPAKFAVNQWMNSAGHKRNILGDQWTQTGIGLAVTDDGSYYFTQVFLRRE